MTPCHEPCSSDEECEETFDDNHGVDAAKSDERSGLGGRAVNTGTTGLAVERDKDVLLEGFTHEADPLLFKPKFTHSKFCLKPSA